MLITDLAVDDNVSLVFTIGSREYEVTSKIVGTTDEYILLEPMEYKKQILQLDSRKFSGLVYNLYAYDHKDVRVAWNNVVVTIMTYKDSSYYGIRTRAFNRESVYSDRRLSSRMNVEDLGGSFSYEDDQIVNVQLKDISSSGVSFICNDITVSFARGVLHVDDKIRGEVFSLDLKCKYVRQEILSDGRIRFGCSFVETDRRLMSYLFLRKMFERTSETESKEAQDTLDGFLEV